MLRQVLRACCCSAILFVFVPQVMAQANLELRGTIRDASGNSIAQATVRLLNHRQSVLATVHPDAEGRFLLSNLSPGSYEVLVTSRSFAPRRVAVRLFAPGADELQITLGVPGIAEEVTISADFGLAQNPDDSSQQVNIINESRLAQRAKSVLAQIADEEPGLQLQRTSTTIGAIFVRGLTGAKVVTFLDGIRYSTAAARGGINTFFNLNDADNLRAVEILRGPNSAQFGSDTLGGGVHLLSQPPLFSADRLEVHGRTSVSFDSADVGYGSNALMTFGGRDLSVLLNLKTHRSNTLRSGGGIDTHAAVTRFLGLPSDIFGARLTDTAFTQYGGLFRLSYLLAPRHQITMHYQRGQQDGGKRYDQTLGGDGNLIADLRNLMLDFFYTRYEYLHAAPFDTVAVSYSYNAQREERVNQGGNGNPNGAISHQPERTSVHGFQVQALKQWGARHNLTIGGEFYRDLVRTNSWSLNPVTQVATVARGRVPDRASYRSGGVYVQDVFALLPDRLRLTGAVRYSTMSYQSRAASSPLVNGRPLWPDDSLQVDAVTPRFGAVLTVTPGLNLSVQISRGFRAPHITDLGTLGLTGNGYEVPVADLAGLNASIGSSAGRDAVSTGSAARQLAPEASWSYEGGVHLRHHRLSLDVTGFVNNLKNNIAIQALILPPGAVGLRLGDQTITSQLSNGVVFVSASTAPVLIRTNFDEARIYGIEQNFEARLSANVTLGNTFTWLRAEDRRTGLPPNIEGGTPAPQGWIHLRFESTGRRYWIEPYLHAARRQTRLSTLDLEDRRTGATRSRGNISNFFLRGATVRGLIEPGTDGRLGTADDRLRATGETLAQVQDRVLGPGVSNAPLFTYIPGFAVSGIRGGFRLGEQHEILLDLDNLTDRNYRGISWGLDAPGRGISVRYNFRF